MPDGSEKKVVDGGVTRGGGATAVRRVRGSSAWGRSRGARPRVEGREKSYRAVLFWTSRNSGHDYPRSVVEAAAVQESIIRAVRVYNIYIVALHRARARPTYGRRRKRKIYQLFVVVVVIRARAKTVYIYIMYTYATDGGVKRPQNGPNWECLLLLRFSFLRRFSSFFSPRILRPPCHPVRRVRTPPARCAPTTPHTRRFSAVVAAVPSTAILKTGRSPDRSVANPLSGGGGHK